MITQASELNQKVKDFIKENGEFYQYQSYLTYEAQGMGGLAVYYVSQKKNELFVIALIEREIGNKSLKDLISPYGYTGYLSSSNTLSFIQDSINEFCAFIDESGYVSTFLRLNPFYNDIILEETIYKTHLIQSKVVGVPLNLSYEEINSKYSSNRKREIQLLKGQNFKISFKGIDGIDDFKEVYDDTMKRLDAKEYYFFDKEYYQMLASCDDKMEIAVCRKNGVVACAALFMKSKDVIQYHLGGTAHSFIKDAPIKLVLDRAVERYIGKSKVLNLGGGVGSQEDSLFKFKSGFSPVTRRFSSLRVINNLKSYNNLCSNFSKSEKKDLTNFFPLYRSS
jgi:hypothetical protein